MLKVFIVDHGVVAQTDDGLGAAAKRWLGLICWEAVSVQEATATFAELKQWVRAHANPNRTKLLVFLEGVWIKRVRLLACLHAGSPTGALKGTYNEVYNFMLKTQLGKRGAGSLVSLAEAVAAVAKTSVSLSVVHGPHRCSSTPSLQCIAAATLGRCSSSLLQHIPSASGTTPDALCHLPLMNVSHSPAPPRTPRRTRGRSWTPSARRTASGRTTRRAESGCLAS